MSKHHNILLTRANFFILSAGKIESVLKFKTKSFEYRSTQQRFSVRKGVLRNFAKFKGKHLCQSLFLIETLVQVFYCEFWKISKNTVFAEHV